MIDRQSLNEVLTQYKENFPSHWEEERYKWKAVKCFQDNWDINAQDFPTMLSKSLSKTENLLASNYDFSRKMIELYAEQNPEEVRSMFMQLFDEKIDLIERVKGFIARADKLLETYGPEGKQHYQKDGTITTYLWLRYPDNYWIYRYKQIRDFAIRLKSDHLIKMGNTANNIRECNSLYTEARDVIAQDSELVDMFRAALTDDCYPDPKLVTLTADVAYFSKNFKTDENHFDAGNPPEPVETEDSSERGSSIYTKQDFLSEVFMPEEKYDKLAAVLLNKKNIILQGAPGVGKTFSAKRLAYSLIGAVNEDAIEFVQFHQNYSYEDFMMGYKPSGSSFKLKEGVFYRFCKKAEADSDAKYFFIIDEINRGNLSKIFGELLMLIENDYRGTPATLAYNDKKFSVPENLYIIGMMNTADRSLAMIDYALRRRFSFFELEPGFETEGFIQYQHSLKNETFNDLLAKVIELNLEIASDRSLGRGFCIGHSYFCGRNELTCSDEWMQEVVDYDILPMLGEYWFDDQEKYLRWENILHGVFQ